MHNLPQAMIQVLRQFELRFSERVWEWAKILRVGAILAPGNRTVTVVLRVMGVNDERQFQHYSRVYNRTVCSPRAVSRVLLRLRVQAFVPPDAPIVRGLDDHIERWRGMKITARGISRDAVRRWLPDRLLVGVADRTYAALELLAACRGLPQPVTAGPRLRLDAGFSDPAPPRKPGQRGRPSQKGKRQPTLRARLTDPATAWQTVTGRWYGGVSRTVRLDILRTTSALVGPFSLVPLVAHPLLQGQDLPVRQAT